MSSSQEAASAARELQRKVDDIRQRIRTSDDRVELLLQQRSALRQQIRDLKQREETADSAIVNERANRGQLMHELGHAEGVLAAFHSPLGYGGAPATGYTPPSAPPPRRAPRRY